MIEYFLFVHYNFVIISVLILEFFLTRIFKRKNQRNFSIQKKYQKILSLFIFIINFLIIYFLFDFSILTIIIQSAIIYIIYKYLTSKLSLIGITGQIASGKSTVTEYLKKNIMLQLLILMKLIEKFYQERKC
jgi:deoxyadenosine/deoxycytidine kinase